MSGEKEYIERAAAIEIASGYCHPANIAAELAKLHAADVRPVVQCKDCMYAPSGTDDGEDRGFALEWPHDEWPEDNPCPCKCDDGWYSNKPKPDFFCANGKREES